MKQDSKENVAFGIWISIAVLGLVVPAIVGVLIGITPNPVVRSADAGQFVSATSSAGGFFTPGVTSVQTTQGSFAIIGPLSAERGQSLQVIDRLKDGLQICLRDSAPVCAPMAGLWAGQMQPVQHTHHMFEPLVTAIGANGVAAWIALGLLAVLISGIIIAVVTNPAPPEAPPATD